jgi:plasmid stabilization system protein ParE
MRAKWTDYAKEQKRQVADYIRREFGTKRRRKFMQEVNDTVEKLRRSPYIGQIDPLFEAHAATYRSVIINGLNKLVYRVDDDIIHIVGFWDTRMEPEEQAEMTK